MSVTSHVQAALGLEGLPSQAEIADRPSSTSTAVETVGNELIRGVFAPAEWNICLFVNIRVLISWLVQSFMTERMRATPESLSVQRHHNILPCRFAELQGPEFDERLL